MSGHGLYINGQWKDGAGPLLARHDPSDGQMIWQQPSASADDVQAAVAAAVNSGDSWRRLSLEDRAKYLDAFAEVVLKRRDELAAFICVETGKPHWESMTEVDAVHRKIAATRESLHTRRATSEATREGVTTATRYRPLGAVAVLGPFNLPAHLPNGQITAALLAGNTVVFKPSELTPSIGEVYAAMWEEAGLPPGVFNLIQGGREQGAQLAGHADIAGVFFTGSHAGGVALSKLTAAQPEKLLALEMGGNNPIIAAGVADLDAAAYAIVLSAFITAGQRCTCARRLILLEGEEGNRILNRVTALAGKLVVGPYSATPEPFMGPVITEAAGERLLAAQDDLLSRGGTSLLRMASLGSRINMLSPGIIDVTKVPDRTDDELFGPLLQVIRVPDFPAALAEANRTKFGLAASLFAADRILFDQFYSAIKAGIVNWNRPTTGAAGNLPFGGIGASGNHRPAGAFAIDFCSDPVASIESSTLILPGTLMPGTSL